jgi:hypothetical protein
VGRSGDLRLTAGQPLRSATWPRNNAAWLRGGSFWRSAQFVKKISNESLAISIRWLVPQEGFEPPTPSLRMTSIGVISSNHDNFRRARKIPPRTGASRVTEDQRVSSACPTRFKAPRPAALIGGDTLPRPARPARSAQLKARRERGSQSRANAFMISLRFSSKPER